MWPKIDMSGDDILVNGYKVASIRPGCPPDLREVLMRFIFGTNSKEELSGYKFTYDS